MDYGHEGVCNCWNASFCLKHAVTANFSGKTVLIFGGAIVAFFEGATLGSRICGACNALGMLFGQYWYSAFWSPYGTKTQRSSLDVFYDVRPQDPKDRNHALLNIFPWSWLWTFLAGFYYLGFGAAFLAVGVEETAPLIRAYDFTAGAWHLYFLALLWFTTVLDYCGARRGTPAPIQEKKEKKEKKTENRPLLTV